MDQDLIKSIADLLTVTYSTLVNCERIAAEQELARISKNRTGYFQALLCIISSDMNHFTKNSAGLYLKKFVKECMENEYLLSEDILNWGELIFTKLSSLNIEDSLRTNLGYALLPLLSLENTSNGLLNTLIPHIVSGLSSSPHISFSMLKLIQVIYSGYSHNPLLFQYFLKLIPEIAGLVYRTFNLDDLSKWNLLEEASLSIRSIIEHFQICERSRLIDIQAMPELSAMFRDLIEANLNDLNINERSLVHIGTDLIHVKYNDSKKNTFEAMNLLIEGLISYAQTDDLFSLEQSPLLNMVIFQMEYLVKSLELVLTRNDKDEIMQMEYVSGLIKEILDLLNHLCPLQRFFFFFSQNYKRLAYSVCLPLIQANLNDLEIFEDTPEEFVYSASDLCENKESDVFKTSAVKLIINICKSVDGSLTEIWKFLYEQVFGAFENRISMSENPLLNLPNEFRAELGLFGFCVLAPCVRSRMDLIQYIEELFRSHLNNFFTAKFLVKSRVCLLVKYYAQFLFYNEETWFLETVTFLLVCCNIKENDCASLNFQASNSLCSILQSDEVLIRIFSFLPKIFQYLIEIIPFQNEKHFFESIYEMVSTNISVIYPFVDKLVPSLVRKIITIMQTSSKKRNKIIIDYCWNIVQCILDSKKTQENEALELETYVLPLFEYLKSPNKVYFEDKILQFEVTLMKKCLEVSAAGWNLAELLPHLQIKSKFSLSHLFSFINTLVHIGKSTLQNNPAFLLLILERCEQCFLNSQSQLELAEASLLYQQIIVSFKSLSQHFSLLILTISQKISPSNKNFYNSKLFGIIFACAVSDIQTTLTSLSNIYPAGAVDFIKLFASFDCISNNYDLKLAICGLCEILRTLFSVEVFQVIIFLLSPRRKDQIEPDKGEFTVKIRPKGFSAFERDENEMAIRVSTMFNELVGLDEYQYFKDVMQEIQNSSLEQFGSLVQRLSKDQVEELSEIIRSKRVSIGTGVGNLSEVRRIVKPVIR